MKHGLPGLSALIDDKTKTLDAVLTGKPRTGNQYSTDQSRIFSADTIGAGNMLLGNDQKMLRRLWRNVPKSDEIIILKQLVNGDLPFGDFTEKTIFSHKNFLCKD